MSYIAGALTIDGYINANAPGNSSGIVVDGVEIGIPACADWNASAIDGEAFILNKPTKLSEFYNDLTSLSGDLNVPGNLTVGGSASNNTSTSTGNSGYATDPNNGFRLVDCPFVAGTPTLYANPFVPAGALQQNADWTATNGVTQIKNKPVIPAAQISSDWNASSGISSINNKPNLNLSQPWVGCSLSAGWYSNLQLVSDGENNFQGGPTGPIQCRLDIANQKASVRGSIRSTSIQPDVNGSVSLFYVPSNMYPPYAVFIPCMVNFLWGYAVVTVTGEVRGYSMDYDQPAGTSRAFWEWDFNSDWYTV